MSLPSRDSDPLTWLLFRQDDVATWRQATRHLSHATVRHRLASGRWRRVHHNVLVTHTGPLTRAQRLWVAVLATRGVLAGETALAEYGLRRYRSDIAHVVITARRQVRNVPEYVVVHRASTLADRDVYIRGTPPRTMPARAMVEAAAWAPSDDAACALIAATFQRRILDLDEVNEVLRRLPRIRRRRLIALTAADAEGGSHSLAELRYLRHNRAFGLPEPTRQEVRTDASGRRRYLDIYYEDWKVHVEIDGGQHNEPGAQWSDMRRQNEVWVRGDRVLRFPAWLVRVRPHEVFAQVHAALVAAGWRP